MHAIKITVVKVVKRKIKVGFRARVDWKARVKLEKTSYGGPELETAKPAENSRSAENIVKVVGATSGEGFLVIIIIIIIIIIVIIITNLLLFSIKFVFSGYLSLL